MGRSLINQYGQQTDWTCSERALRFIDTMCGDLESKILHVIEHCVPISVQKTTKDAKSHRKATGKARNSVVLERKGTLHGVVLTHLLQTSTLLLPLKLRTNTNLWNGNLKSAMIKKLPKK